MTGETVKLSKTATAALSVRPKFHLARLDSTRHDTFDFVEPVERVETSESSLAVPTWRRTTKKL